MTVYDIILENNIYYERELFVLAHSQKEEGKTDLLEYVLKISDKRRAELIRTAWRIENSTKETDRLKQTNMEILEKATENQCVCYGQWSIHAIKTLHENNIDIEHFKTAIKNAIQHGRKKTNNLIIVGPYNCGKTFLLQLITEILKCFVSPATGTFAWVGA